MLMLVWPIEMLTTILEKYFDLCKQALHLKSANLHLSCCCSLEVVQHIWETVLCFNKSTLFQYFISIWTQKKLKSSQRRHFTHQCWSRWGARHPSAACRAASGRRWWRNGPPSCRTCATSGCPRAAGGRRTTGGSSSSSSRCESRTGLRWFHWNAGQRRKQS